MFIIYICKSYGDPNVKYWNKSCLQLILRAFSIFFTYNSCWKYSSILKLMSSSSWDKLRVKRLFPNYSYWGWCSLFKQGQPTIRRSKYCLKFSNARESPKISGLPFPFFQPVFLHILLPRQCNYCSKIISPENFNVRTILPLDFSNEGLRQLLLVLDRTGNGVAQSHSFAV